MASFLLTHPLSGNSASRDALMRARRTAASGLDAFTERLQVISENLANVHTTAPDSRSDPYARRLVVFSHDHVTGQVNVKKIVNDPTPFRKERNPMHPAADEQGFVKLTNVNPLIEMADMRQTGHSYDACLKAYQVSLDLDRKTIDLLRV